MQPTTLSLLASYDNLLRLSAVLAAALLGVYLLRRRLEDRRAKKKLAEAVKLDLNVPQTLHPVINPDICIGSGSCVSACPEGKILGLVDGVATLVGAVLSVLAGRVLADFLPFRVRPLNSPELGLVLPYGVSGVPFRRWSSFPSDHAMVFFAMSTGLWYVSKNLSAWLTLYVVFIIALPRVYLGYHYPTDIIGGALFGSLFAYLANLGAVRESLAAPAMRWLDAHPASFYTCFFLFSQGLASLFDPLRELASSLFPR